MITTIWQDGGWGSILLIFAVGNLLNAGFEQILLLYSPSVYSVSAR